MSSEETTSSQITQDSEQNSSNENSTNNKQTSNKTHSFDAHLPTNIINKDLVSPSIDQIIEEDEEEEEEKEVEVDLKSVATAIQEESSNSNNEEPKIVTTISKISNIATPTTITTHETTKFVLEPVILPENNNAPISTMQDPILTNPTNNSDDAIEATEIRVEEGYATRQMDEYFRQTIAAIKEELTKKLENKNDTNQTNHNQDKEESYSYYDTTSSDYDQDDVDDRYDHDDNDETNLNDTNITENTMDQTVELGNQDLLHHGYTKFNRNLLYQHLLMFNKRKSTKLDSLNTWLVIIGCILNHFIIDGVCYNYANLFDLIQTEFKQSSKLVASMPFTFLIGFYLLIAPISLYLTKMYGSRRIALIGTFISSLSLLICSFIKESIVGFIIFYGVFTGTGLGLIYIPSLITTSKWFLKKRLFANSITILGACLGAAVYPLISELILRKYDLFDSIFILAGIQLNCLVGSVLLRERKKVFSLTHHTVNHSSSHHRRTNVIIDNVNQVNEKNNNVKNGDIIEMKVKSSSTTAKSKLNKISHTGKIGKPYRKKNFLLNNQNNNIDSETESTTSASTSTVPNYTLKQYWRKFVQTRKSQSNAKKNLFHLIAEEKRKTRTLSKTSLEDGFVITTSNNLLAPNDDSHVIISQQEKLRQQQTPTTTVPVHASSSRVAASRLFTRIANSLRSLAHPSYSSSNQQQQAQQSNTSSPITTTHHSKTQIHTPASNLYDINEASSKSNTVHSQQSPPATIPLMSVFNNPLNDNSTSSNTAATNNEHNNEFIMDDSNASCCDEDFSHDNDELSDEETNNQINPQMNTVKPPATTPTNPHKIINKKKFAPTQLNRYLSYRNSLTNSVRGSLIECSVPEDKEEDQNMSSQNDDDELFNRTSSSGKRPNYRNKRKYQQGTYQAKRSNVNRNNNRMNGNSTINKNRISKQNPDDVGYVIPSLLNIRRYISIIDGFSFFNVPFNLESVEFNLRNSLIKKCSDRYRKRHHQANNYSSKKSKLSFLYLFSDYLSYLTSVQLLKNKILLMLNLSFLFSVIGIFVPLLYIMEYSQLMAGLTRLQSLYILSIIGLSTGIGRILSIIVYKVNKSNAKNRIFSYELTLIFTGLVLLTLIFLCDTLFSFSMFAITFGLLIGFNLNLRSLLIYDIIGLEWSDDSLCFNVILFQSVGVFIGIPISGKFKICYYIFMIIKYNLNI
jgi:MFS family permease